MTVEAILSLFTQGLLTILYVVGPPLGAAMAVGLFVAVMQAATQIQEASLTFVPKMAAIGLTLLFTGRWSIGHLSEFVRTVMEKIQTVGQ